MSRRSPAEGGRGRGDFRDGVADLAEGRRQRGRRRLEAVVRAGGADAVWACQELVSSWLRERGADGAGAKVEAEVEAEVRRLVPEGSALLLHTLGFLRRRSGAAEEGLRLLESVRRMRPRLWASDIEVGWARCQAGDAEDGERILWRAERAFVRRGDDWGVAAARAHRGAALLKRFRLRAARRLLATAVADKERCGDGYGLGNALLNLAVAAFHLGDYHAAIRTYRSALALQERSADWSGAGRTLNNLGACYLDLSEPDRARVALQQALRLFRRLGDIRGAASARGNLGFACRIAGDQRGCERHYRAAIDDLRVSADPVALGTGIANLAEAQTRGGRPRDAMATLASVPARHMGTYGARVALLLAREEARAHLRVGDPRAAIVSVRRGRAAARRLASGGDGYRAEHLDLDILVAEAHLTLGHSSAVVRTLGRAATDLEALLPVQRGAALQVGLLESFRELDDARIRALLRVRRAGPRRAWAVASKAKARLLRETLLGRVAPAGARSSVIAVIETEFRRLAANPVRDAARTRRLRVLRRRYLEEIDSEVRRGRASGRLRPVSPMDLDRELGPYVAVLEYHVGRDQSVVFVAHGGRVEAVELAIGRDALAGMVRRLLAPLEQAGESGDSRASLDSFDVSSACGLHRRILEPALRRLPSAVSQVIIVPDGPLRLLPFELLPASRSTATAMGGEARSPVDWTIDHLTVSYAQSSWLLTGNRRHRASTAGIALLAYSPAPGTVIDATSGTTVAPLPGAEAEAAALVGLLPRARVFEGRRATVAAFRRGAGNGRVLHVAAHAFADSLVPGLSGILLAAGTGSGAELLTADRISRLRIGVDLVTLSACDAGRGRLRGREGVLGLVRALFEGGAHAVIGSLWPVDDEVARCFMLAFYRRLVAGHSRAEALAEAKREIRSGASANGLPLWHPFFWAPFVLFDHAPGCNGPAAPRAAGPFTPSRAHHWQPGSTLATPNGVRTR